MAETKVAFAESAVVVHIARSAEPGLLPDGTEGWDVDSKVLLPGETVALSEMPPYLRNAVKKGEVPGLKLLTPAAAKRRVDTWNDLAGIASPPVALEEEFEQDSEFPIEEV